MPACCSDLARALVLSKHRCHKHSPVMRSSRVLLPTPFGPAMPSRSPGRNSNVKSRMSWRPPSGSEKFTLFITTALLPGREGGNVFVCGCELFVGLCASHHQAAGRPKTAAILGTRNMQTSKSTRQSQGEPAHNLKHALRRLLSARLKRMRARNRGRGQHTL